MGFGFEIKKEFAEAGKKWLEEATAQGNLFMAMEA